jgi:hypothetical protein
VARFEKKVVLERAAPIEVVELAVSEKRGYEGPESSPPKKNSLKLHA